MPLNLFLSYSHKDEDLRNQLATQLTILERLELILPWHDRRIGVRDEWSYEIDEHLRAAQIVLLLLSPDFLASSYCFDIEVKFAFIRHSIHQAVVIPIILRPCDWAGTPFAHLPALPKYARLSLSGAIRMKPLPKWPNPSARRPALLRPNAPQPGQPLSPH